MKTTVSINEMINQSLIPSIKLMNGMDTRQAEAFCGGGRSRHPDRGRPPPRAGANGRGHGPRPPGSRPRGAGEDTPELPAPCNIVFRPLLLKKKKKKKIN